MIMVEAGGTVDWTTGLRTAVGAAAAGLEDEEGAGVGQDVGSIAAGKSAVGGALGPTAPEIFSLTAWNFKTLHALVVVCRRRLEAKLNRLPQWSHAWGFSPVCDNMCCFKALRRVKVKSQPGHSKMLCLSLPPDGPPVPSSGMRLSSSPGSASLGAASGLPDER